MITGATGRGLYDALIVVHAALALVGFGAVGISGVYGFTTRHPEGAPALAEARRYFASPGRLEWLVAVVPVPGAAALAVEPGGRGVAQLWAGLALVVWACAAVVLARLVRPAEARVRAILGGRGGADGGPDPVALAAAATRLGRAGLAMDVAFLVALLLMVVQPH